MGSSARLGPARIGLLAGSGLFAALALGSGIDRMSRTNPALAEQVWAPFASQALRSRAKAAIEKGDAVNGLRYGEAAVADAPVDPESAAMLGMARLMIGDRRGADAAFRVAGRLGWRVFAVQAYWMDRALAAGDTRVAALRLDALLRQQPDLVGNRRLLDPLEQTSAGRMELAGRLLLAPAWRDPYSRKVADLGREVLLNRAAVLDAYARRGGSLGCEAVAPLVERLIDSSAIGEAAQLWRQHCPGAAAALVHDGGFAQAALGQDRSQFAWSFIGQADASALLEPSGNPPAKQLVIETTAPTPRLIVRQLVIVEPGAYRLSWRASEATGKPSPRALAALTCAPDPREWMPARLDSASGRWQADIEVDQSCAARWLGLGVAPGSGAISLGDIALRRLP